MTQYVLEPISLWSIQTNVQLLIQQTQTQQKLDSRLLHILIFSTGMQSVLFGS